MKVYASLLRRRTRALDIFLKAKRKLHGVLTEISQERTKQLKKVSEAQKEIVDAYDAMEFLQKEQDGINTTLFHLDTLLGEAPKVGANVNKS